MSAPPERRLLRADEPLRDGGPREAAGFIVEAVSDLARIARPHGLDMLGFLLDMAQMEAEERVRRDDR